MHLPQPIVFLRLERSYKKPKTQDKNQGKYTSIKQRTKKSPQKIIAQIARFFFFFFPRSFRNIVQEYSSSVLVPSYCYFLDSGRRNILLNFFFIMWENGCW